MKKYILNNCFTVRLLIKITLHSPEISHEAPWEEATLKIAKTIHISNIIIFLHLLFAVSKFYNSNIISYQSIENIFISSCFCFFQSSNVELNYITYR